MMRVPRWRSTPASRWVNKHIFLSLSLRLAVGRLSSHLAGKHSVCHGNTDFEATPAPPSDRKGRLRDEGGHLDYYCRLVNKARRRSAREECMLWDLYIQIWGWSLSGMIACVCFGAITPPLSAMMTFMENYQWLFFFLCNPLSRDVMFYLSASGRKITVGTTGVSYCCYQHWQWLCSRQASQWVMTVRQCDRSLEHKKGMIWFSHCSFSYLRLCFSCFDTMCLLWNMPVF